jgi:hypothetical protein
MKFNLINTTLLASGLFASSLAFADTIAVSNGAVFLIGGSPLSVQLLSGESPSEACTTQLAGQPINLAATEIVISGSKAVVAPGLATPVDVVNISSCLSESSDNEAEADLQQGTLTIPCLNIDDTIYNVTMEQRGNSMNWEVVFGEPVTDGSCDI